jgi:high-affinity iron transporter
MSIFYQQLHRSLEESWEEGKEDNNLFSVPVFFVLLRETVEVCLIVSTTFAYLADNRMSHYKRYAVLGTVLGSLVFLIIGGALVATFYTVKNNAFDSDSNSGKIFEGKIIISR